MKKLSPFAGVIALAVAFGLAGAANAGRPEGAGGGPPGGPSPTVSEFSSPFVDLDCIPDPLPYPSTDPPVATCEVPGSSGTINSLGVWDVQTTGLIEQTMYEVCLVGLRSDGYGGLVETTISLDNGMAELQNGDVVLTLFGTIAAADGDWVGLSFQIIEGDNCGEIPRQESGLTLTGSDPWMSQFSSPFVDVACVEDPMRRDCEVTDSKGLINNAGDWVVLTNGLSRRIEYKVCLDALSAPFLEPMPPFRLATRSAQKKGTFFASGNLVERYFFQGNWVGLSLQIYLHNNNDLCVDGFVQETGITIVVP